MKDAVSIVDAPLVTNQVEFHPLLNQDKLLEGANEAGIPLSSYSSVARGEVFKHPEFGEIGAGRYLRPPIPYVFKESANCTPFVVATNPPALATTSNPS